LYRSTLNGANLAGVNFAGMKIEPVNFRGADLRGAKNLVDFTPTTPKEKRIARYHRATDKIF
jgi:uncharacterized protein YjbI with pentapeptide repeats